MQREARFWDRIADKYARRPVEDEASYQHKLEVTRGYLTPEMELLEFGCGTGSTALVHAPHVRHILATDISARMIEIAKGKAGTAGVDNVTFRQAGIDDLSEDSGPFDMVLGMSILHLVADRDPVIAKVFRLLKPGGLFVSSTVCIGDGLGFIRYIAPAARALGLFPLLRVFTARELEDSVTAAGFQIEVNWRPGPRKAVFIVARKPGE